MPSNSRSSRSSVPQCLLKISTSPEVGSSNPSKISMVVVFPAPFVGSQRKRHRRGTDVRGGKNLPRRNLNRHDVPVAGRGDVEHSRLGRYQSSGRADTDGRVLLHVIVKRVQDDERARGRKGEE